VPHGQELNAGAEENETGRDTTKAFDRPQTFIFSDFKELHQHSVSSLLV
jgi:hypothetical protein